MSYSSKPGRLSIFVCWMMGVPTEPSIWEVLVAPMVVPRSSHRFEVEDGGSPSKQSG